MPTVIWDIETYSQVSLKELGSHVYAQHASTGVHFIGFAVDNGEVQTWRPGDPVPQAFADPSGFTFVSFNWTFENAILRHVLMPRHGFAAIPWASQDCAMRLALANAYPAELGLVCEALGLPYRKDPEARKAMLRLSGRGPRKRPRSLSIPRSGSGISRCCSNAAGAMSRRHAPSTGRNGCDLWRRKSASSCCSTPRSASAESAPTCRFSKPSATSRLRSATPSMCGSTS
jgi:hypothetical protein